VRRPEESDGTDGNHLCVRKENKGAGAKLAKEPKEEATEEFFFLPEQPLPYPERSSVEAPGTSPVHHTTKGF
jgi:hypothetical protein